MAEVLLPKPRRGGVWVSPAGQAEAGLPVLLPASRTLAGGRAHPQAYKVPMAIPRGHPSGRPSPMSALTTICIMVTAGKIDFLQQLPLTSVSAVVYVVLSSLPAPP